MQKAYEDMRKWFCYYLGRYLYLFRKGSLDGLYGPFSALRRSFAPFVTNAWKEGRGQAFKKVLNSCKEEDFFVDFASLTQETLEEELDKVREGYVYGCIAQVVYYKSKIENLNRFFLEIWLSG